MLVNVVLIANLDVGHVLAGTVENEVFGVSSCRVNAAQAAKHVVVLGISEWHASAESYVLLREGWDGFQIWDSNPLALKVDGAVELHGSPRRLIAVAAPVQLDCHDLLEAQQLETRLDTQLAGGDVLIRLDAQSDA